MKYILSALKPWFFAAFCLWLSLLNGQAETKESFQRSTWVMGWHPAGQKLLFREETRMDAEMFIRVALLDLKTGKISKEFTIQEREDKPDIVSVRENNLKVFMEKDGFVQTPNAQFFIGSEYRGFLSPNGQFLIQTKMKFQSLASKRGLQTLKLTFSGLDLKTVEEFEIAQMKIESLDGERPLGPDAIGAITLNEVNWGPKGKNIAVVLEEKHGQTQIQGVFTLKIPPQMARGNKMLPRTPQPVKKLWSQKKTPKKAKTSSPSSKPSRINPSVPLSPTAQKILQDYYSPKGGSPFLMEWTVAKTQPFPGQSLTAVHHYFRTCPEDTELTFAPQVTVLNPQEKTFLEFKLSASLNPKDLDFRWSDQSLEVWFQNEILRNIPLQSKKFTRLQDSQKILALQLGSYTNEKSAISHVQKLCMKGIPAYYLKHQGTSGSKPLYRVRISRFKEEKDAHQYAQVKMGEVSPEYVVIRF